MTRYSLPCALALTALIQAATPIAQAQCNRRWGDGFFGPNYIDNHHGLTRSSHGNISADAYWPSEAIDAYHRATEGYIYMDTTNLQIYIHPSTTTTSTFTSWGATPEVLHRYTTFPTNLAGTTTSYLTWPSNVVQHFDIRIRGVTDSVPRNFTTINNGSVLPGTFYSTSCVFPAHSTIVGGLTESVTFSHEIAHAYGYDHFDGWLATSNTFLNETFNCELGTAASSLWSMFVVPSAYEHQCHDSAYGIFDGVDLGISPHWNAGAPNALQSTIDFAPTIDIPASATTFSVPFPGGAPLRFTTFSNRDTHVGSVHIRPFLSSDPFFNAGDVQATGGVITSTGWSAGATVTRAFPSVSFNPQVAMPVVGTVYRLLIVLDSTNAVSETRESNNVTDTGFTFRRI